MCLYENYSKKSNKICDPRCSSTSVAANRILHLISIAYCTNSQVQSGEERLMDHPQESNSLTNHDLRVM
jgi:hypothetical protein